jgi:hypothetical protein
MPRRIPAGLLFAVLALMPGTAQAQFGIKAGLSFASASTSDYLPNLSVRTGWTAGLSVGLPLGSVLELRPELLYVQKGGKLPGGSTLELKELDLPGLLQINLPVTGFMPYVFAGPQAEFELSCTAFDVDCVDSRSLRWGAVGGAGVRLARVLSIEGRYNWTLSEIADDIKSKPRTLLILVGLHVGAKR